MTKNKLFNFSLIALVSLIIGGKMTFAAAPNVSVDETAYVLLDYYGQVDEVSVVKACDLNGNKQFVDYGNYREVANMSTLDQPIINQNSLVWSLAEGAPTRFYYQVTPLNQQFSLPWLIDVSYQLNGVPIKADELAGKSGLVVIEVTVAPNEQLDEYFANNFILSASMIVNRDDNLSFNAPGAQLQTIGNYQIALFMAMPQETATFRFEIGSENFENSGVIIAMMPATMGQLDQMSTVREHKQTIETAGRAFDQSLDDIFSLMTAMNGGINQTISGLAQLDETRATIYQAQAENTKAGNSVVSSINDLTDKVNRLDNLQNDPAYQWADQNLTNNVWMQRANQTLAVGDSGKGMINNLSTFANAMKTTVDTNDEQLNSGARDTLQGMTTMMTNMSAAMDKTNNLQKNKNLIVDAGTSEWRRLNDEFHLVDIDTQATKVSLTSAQNLAPHSLQIILRTPEITSKTATDAALVAANTEDTVWGRIKIIFAQIGAVFTAWSK